MPFLLFYKLILIYRSSGVILPFTRRAAYYTSTAANHHIMRRPKRSPRHPERKPYALAYRQGAAQVKQDATRGYIACLRHLLPGLRTQHHRKRKREPHRTPDVLSRLNGYGRWARIGDLRMRLLVHKVLPVSRESFQITLPNFLQTIYGTKVYTGIRLVNACRICALPRPVALRRYPVAVSSG